MKHSLSLSLLLSLSLWSCSALAPPPPPPPPSPSEALLKARALYEEGDWEALREAVKSLPSAGPFAEEGYFYNAVAKGIKHPKYGLDSLRSRERKGAEELRERNQLFQLVFQGMRGECLLAIGPLKALYAPKLDQYPKGTRSLVQGVLRSCDERRASRMRKLSSDLKETQEAPSPQPVKGVEAQEAKAPSPEEGPQLSSKPSTVAQLQSVTPHIALFLPKKSKERSKLAGQLLEVTPIARERIERTGKPLKIEIFEPQGAAELTELIVNLDPRVQLLLGFTLSRTLHEALIEASRAQARPLIIMSPHALTLDQEDRIWRLFTTTSSIASALIKDARASQAKRVLTVTASGSSGLKLAQEIKEVTQDAGLTWAGHEVTPPLKDSASWESLAKRLSEGSFDTLIMALSPSQSAQLVTYLAAQGVWSAQGAEFERALPPLNQAKRDDERRPLRIYLWPSAYDHRALKQAGRYLEGARLVSPVYLEGDDFMALNQTLQEEINRKAHIIDPLLLVLIELLDLPLRESLLKDQALVELLQGFSQAEGLLPALSFERRELMGSLKLIEVKDQTFTLRRREPQEAPPILPSSPERGEPAPQ